MNLLAHIRVARNESDDPFVWLGAALPDLQREAGVPVGPLDSWCDAVRAGVGCHRVADAAFHDLPIFLTQTRALNVALSEAGVPRGAARAVAHAGWEILFDGALVDDRLLMDAYGAAMAVSLDDAGPRLDADHAERWRVALARRVARGAPRLYADPSSVAELLWRILSPRRLLAFDHALVPTIADVLRDVAPTIAACSADVFAALERV